MSRISARPRFIVGVPAATRMVAPVSALQWVRTMTLRIPLVGLALAAAACHPAYDLDVRVGLAPSDHGAPLIVSVVDSPDWNGEGLPGLDSGEDTRILLATVADRDSYEIAFTDYWCPRTLYVSAWVDRDGSAGIEALLRGRTFDANDYADHRSTLRAIAMAVPEPGDVRAIAGPLDFDVSSDLACDPSPQVVELVPSPL